MQIQELQARTRSVFEKYPDINTVRVFGSIARGQATAESDVDLLMNLGKLPHGVWGMVGIKLDLEAVLKKKVDLVSEKGISTKFAKSITPDLILIYEK